MVCVSNRVNANLDLIVSAIPLLETLGLLPGQPVDHTHLGTVEELQEQVAYSMEHCAGTERVFSSQSEFERVVTAAYQLPHSVSLVCVCVCVCVRMCRNNYCLVCVCVCRNIARVVKKKLFIVRSTSSEEMQHSWQPRYNSHNRTHRFNQHSLANKTFTK